MYMIATIYSSFVFFCFCFSFLYFLFFCFRYGLLYIASNWCYLHPFLCHHYELQVHDTASWIIKNYHDTFENKFLCNILSILWTEKISIRKLNDRTGQPPINMRTLDWGKNDDLTKKSVDSTIRTMGRYEGQGSMKTFFDRSLRQAEDSLTAAANQATLHGVRWRPFVYVLCSSRIPHEILSLVLKVPIRHLKHQENFLWNSRGAYTNDFHLTPRSVACSAAFKESSPPWTSIKKKRTSSKRNILLCM